MSPGEDGTGPSSDPPKVAVLLGGASEEREVSLASGVQVARALREVGHEVVAFDTTRGPLGDLDEERILEAGVASAPPAPGDRDLTESGDLTFLTRAPEFEGTEVIFPALHGGAGEDGTLQALLEIAGIPYVGSRMLGCALAMDKDVTKRLLRDAGIPTPAWVTRTVQDLRGSALQEGPDVRELDRVVETVGFPMVVKPPSGGSTLGLRLVRERAELPDAVTEALRYEAAVLFEAYVAGRETTVGIVGDEALPVGEIIPAHELFDYECKYQPGLAEEIFPADLDAEVTERLRARAREVHGLLRLRDFSRVDFMVEEDGSIWCLEANALPGLTANSLLPRAARASGTEFPGLCQRLVGLAAQRACLPGYDGA